MNTDTGKRREKTLVFLVGPPAVGKMTVGEELSRITGLPLFHNHLSIEAVLPVFGFGHPSFNRLVDRFRSDVFSEVVQSDLPGLIFTFVWAFNHPGELTYVQKLIQPFETSGGRVVFVELWADLDTRLERNATANRLAAKASKRDVEASRNHLIQAEEEWDFRPDGPFPLEPHLFVDNTELSPEEAATRIARHFRLPGDDE